MASYGIDFGTTNSVMAVFKNGKTETLDLVEPYESSWGSLGFDNVMPTLYGIDKEGNILIGWDVKNPNNFRGSNSTKITAVKRMFQGEDTLEINGNKIYAEEIATAIINFMKRQAEKIGHNVSSAVITIPANSKANARYKTKISAGMAGIQVISLINEPTAAAMSYAYNMPFDQTLIVVDWGGGTLDVTLLQAEDGIFIERASKGIAKNGGIDFDNKIASGILKDLEISLDEGALNEFMLEVEKAKIRLSKLDSTNIQIKGYGNYTLTRENVENWVLSYVKQVEQPIRQVMQEAGITPDELDALLLVGGTCNMPVVRNFIQKELPEVTIAENVNPMTAIAEGAAIAAAILNGEAEDKGFFVATEHALGTMILDISDPETIQTGTPRRKFSSIISKNHKLPAKETKTYYPVSPESTEIVIDIAEGEEGMFDDNDSVVIYQIDSDMSSVKIDNQKENNAVDVTFEYDTNGIIHVSTFSHSTGETKTFDVTSGTKTSPSELVAMSKKAKENANKAFESSSSTNIVINEVTHPDAKIVKNKILPFLDSEEAEEASKAIEILSSGDSNEDEILAAEETIRVIIQEHSYLL